MKYNGRFLKSLVEMIFPLARLIMFRAIYGDDGGGAAADGAGSQASASDPLDAMFPKTNLEDTASPGGGKADTATDGGKDASGGDDKNGKADGAPSVKEKAPVVSEEDLEAALSPVESPEQKAARVEREYKASSKEAQRLNSENKAIAKALEEQGLKLFVKDGKVGWVPTEKYSGEQAPFEVKVSKMSVQDQEALESGDLSEVQKVLDRVWSEAISKLARPYPTREKEPSSISEEKVSAVFESLADAKDELDTPKNPNFKKNEKLIRSFINHPVRPQALRDAFAAAPEEVAPLVNSYINAIREVHDSRAESVKAANEKKKEEARQRAEAGITDEGSVRPQAGTGDFLNAVGASRFR